MRAQAPVRHFRRGEDEAVAVGGFETGRRADRAVHVDDRAARRAHEVMVVVADAQLEEHRPAGSMAHEPASAKSPRALYTD
jgi:hypothetical protein